MTPLQVHRHQPGVYLGGLKLFVPQHPGDILHRSAAADKVGGEGMAQIVRGKAPAKAVFAAQPPERLVYRTGVWACRVTAINDTKNNSLQK